RVNSIARAASATGQRCSGSNPVVETAPSSNAEIFGRPATAPPIRASGPGAAGRLAATGCMARPSAYGFDRSIVVVGTHPAGPAAGRSLFLGLIRIVARLLPAIIVIADSGRKYGRIETVFLVPGLAAAIGLGTCTSRRR